MVSDLRFKKSSMKNLLTIFFTAVLAAGNLAAQESASAIDKVKFFTDDSVFQATLSFDLSKLVNGKMKPVYLPATFTCKVNDTIITEAIRLIARGKTRKKICYMPPVKLDFSNPGSPKLSPLGSLKMVAACRLSGSYEQLLLAEYLAYKIYNLLTEKSFRVRLLQLDYVNSRNNKKALTQHAFLIEDVKDLAKRNGCKEVKDPNIRGLYTDRVQFTYFSIFQYMIGNTDWGVSTGHNCVLISSKKDSLAKAFAIPYDFDYSGLLDAEYAVPTEGLGLENIRERLYRGSARTRAELDEVLGVFKKQKDNIYELIKNFTLLTIKNRNRMMYYIDDFYKIIDNPRTVKNIFIDKAGT
jgi:hypothetical protein